jgi:hypothetical protein
MKIKVPLPKGETVKRTVVQQVIDKGDIGKAIQYDQYGNMVPFPIRPGNGIPQYNTDEEELINA